jgi:hypothetical protein
MSDRQELLDDYEKSKPEDTDFRQQRLRAWQPLLIPRSVVLTFILLGCIFLPIGFAIWDGSKQIVEVTQRYDEMDCDLPEPAPCTKALTLTIPEDIPKPVYFYYKLTNFYQNHRRYVKSRSELQLQGDLSGSNTNCDPLETFNNKTLFPCGLVANSYFNDTFANAIITPASTGVPEPLAGSWSEKGISWEVDREQRFVEKFGPGSSETLPDDYTRDGPQGELPYLDNEHFMNWMRPAAFPTFRKLYAYINTDLKKGDKITVSVADNFNNRQYSGTKSVVLSNASWIGGKNFFLAWLYVGVGAFCFFMAIVVLLKQIICPRRLGNMASVVDLKKVQNTE